jgi:hypothetical protein
VASVVRRDESGDEPTWSSRSLTEKNCGRGSGRAEKKRRSNRRNEKGIDECRVDSVGKERVRKVTMLSSERFGNSLIGHHAAGQANEHASNRSSKSNMPHK